MNKGIYNKNGTVYKYPDEMIQIIYEYLNSPRKSNMMSDAAVARKFKISVGFLRRIKNGQRKFNKTNFFTK